MAFLTVNLYHDHPGIELDSRSVVESLKSMVDTIEVNADDQLRLLLERARNVLIGNSGPEKAVLAELERNVLEQGPALSFQVTLTGFKFTGVVKRKLLQFEFGDGVPHPKVEELKSILRSVMPTGKATRFRE